MPKRFICERCHKPIGPDERLWWHQPDGSIVDYLYAELAADQRSSHPASRFYHHGCLGAPYPAADA